METIFKNLQENPPLVHNITNYVTVNDCANIVLAAGGSPLMADDIEEVGDIVSISSSLYINVGTLNKRTIASMIEAGKTANAKGIPVVLDPVGMGASKLRNQAVEALTDQVRFSVIKGNMSEIKAMYTTCKNAGGVDVQEGDMISADTLEEAIALAKKVAVKFNSVVAVTGPIDIVTDGTRVKTVHNGHAKMSRITGTGCMTGSVIGTFCGANPDQVLDATATAISVMGIAGEMAHKIVSDMGEGTGSFKRYLMDGVSLMTYEAFERGAAIEVR